MIIQTLLDRMSLYANELDTVAGGDDVTRALVAVNLAQDLFEVMAASHSQILVTYDTFVTLADVETSPWPAALLRLDDLWREDGLGNPVEQLDPIHEAGGHTLSRPWPGTGVSAAPGGTGAPAGYWETGPGGLFYWAPKPDQIYTMRAYGLFAKSDYALAGDTFLYPDTVALPLAAMAAKVVQMGTDRDLSALEDEARDLFAPVLKALQRRNQTGAVSKAYSDIHDT